MIEKVGFPHVCAAILEFEEYGPQTFTDVDPFGACIFTLLPVTDPAHIEERPGIRSAKGSGLMQNYHRSGCNLLPVFIV
jgi:hypothetical protein